MNRTNTCWMSVLAIVLSATIMAAQPGGCELARQVAVGDLSNQADATGPTWPASPCLLLVVLDADGNQEIQQDEILAAPEAILDLDTDGDGAVSPDELCPVSDPPATDPANEPNCPPCPCLLPQTLDGNADGTLSAEEIAAASDALLTLDQNQDQTLTAGEICPPSSPPPPPTRPQLCPLMLVLDADESADLSAEEIANAPESLRVLDANGDGALTADELCPESACPKGPDDGDCGDADDGPKDKGNCGKGHAYGHDKEKHGKGKACGHDKDRPGKCHEDGDDDEDHEQDGQTSCWCLRFCCLMQVLNTDKDCQLSEEEIANAAEALLTLDQDGDGALSAEELCPPAVDNPDNDGDGPEDGCYGGEDC